VSAQALAARFAAAPRHVRGYVGWKARLDPVHRAIMAHAAKEPFGHVLDLGCGYAQLGLDLLASGLADELTGLDWDAARLKAARTAAEGLRARFREVDLQQAGLPACDTTLVIDLLYQLPAAAQRHLLTRITTTTRRLILVRSFDPHRGWRSAFGRLIEHALRHARIYRPAMIEPLPVHEVRQVLQAGGFVTSEEPCWAGTPFPNVLIVARRGVEAG
jgi:SAM-dependent methyltransferase